MQPRYDPSEKEGITACTTELQSLCRMSNFGHKVIEASLEHPLLQEGLMS